MNMAKDRIRQKVEQKISEFSREYSLKLTSKVQQYEDKLKALECESGSQNKELVKKIADLEQQLANSQSALKMAKHNNGYFVNLNLAMDTDKCVARPTLGIPLFIVLGCRAIKTKWYRGRHTLMKLLVNFWVNMVQLMFY